MNTTKTTIMTLFLIIAANAIAATYNSGPPLMAYAQPPAIPAVTNRSQAAKILKIVQATMCPKCKTPQPFIKTFDSKKGYEFECTKCTYAWKSKPAAALMALGGPPPLPVAPARTKSSLPPKTLKAEQSRQSEGFVKHVPFPPIPRIRPQAAGAVELAFHGPPYIVTFNAPYRIQFLYSDYYLEAGKTYQFEEKNDVTGEWQHNTPPYTAAGDEVYGKAPAAFNVNEAFIRFGTAQMRVISP